MQPTDPRDAQIAALREALRGMRLHAPSSLGASVHVVTATRYRELLARVDSLLAAAPAAPTERIGMTEVEAYEIAQRFRNDGSCERQIIDALMRRYCHSATDFEARSAAPAAKQEVGE